MSKSMKREVLFHCGNAPKMERVIDLTLALAERDVAVVKTHVREDFVWRTVGADDEITYDQLADVLPNRPAVDKVTVENALSHGNGAMCEGLLEFADGDQLRFCMVVEFVNTGKDALVKTAHTYYVRKEYK